MTLIRFHASPHPKAPSKRKEYNYNPNDLKDWKFLDLN